jgi:hypothetical protein
MIRPKVTVNMDGFNRKIAGLKENTPKATATALTRTAQYAARKEEDETRRVFNAPTTYTQRAFFTQWATASNLQARVGVKNQSGGRLTPVHWLYAEVEGGEREQKAFERALSNMGFLSSGDSAVPTGAAPRDAYGNVGGGTIRSILSQLQTQQGGTPAKRRRSAKTATYFGVPMGTRSGVLTPGVYMRTGGVKQIFAFQQGKRRYSKRLDFFAVGRRAADERFPIEARLAMKQAIDLTR